MPRWLSSVLLVGVAIVAANGWFSSRPPEESGPSSQDRGAGYEADGRESGPAHRHALPAEAMVTLAAIDRGGPFPHDRDGTVFQNREGRLPERPAGYYREYTVATPGSADRGARRIVSGGDPPEVFYYTDDHYRTFRQLEATR